MPAKIYRIKLTAEETQTLKSICNKGSHKALKFKRANILLLADEASGERRKDSEISSLTGCSIRTIERLRKLCCEVGALATLQAQPREPRVSKITGEVEAHITQLACSKPPAGQARWTLRVLASKAVELDIIESISHRTVGEVLKKAKLNLGESKDGVSHQQKMPPS